MKRTQHKKELEKTVVSEMIALYCKKNHKSGGGLCEACIELESYAQKRSETCPFSQTKTFCSSCTAPCYQPEMRRKIRSVMRFSGPRMLFYHPILALKHLMLSRKEHMRK
ncbi:MAG: nitrous oxide-stimulated promoter family protein [Christensenellales bacterium]|jgi:hypothetical protein